MQKLKKRQVWVSRDADREQVGFGGARPQVTGRASPALNLIETYARCGEKRSDYVEKIGSNVEMVVVV